MTFSESVSTCFKKFIDFSGRASRSEFWYFYLFYLIVEFFVMGIVFSVATVSTDGAMVAYTISMFVFLALLFPLWAVQVRRLHDVNHSGWALLIAFIPIVGAIILLVWSCTASYPIQNQYGAVPEK